MTKHVVVGIGIFPGLSEFHMTTPASRGIVALAKIKHRDQEIHPQDDETARFFDRPIRDRLPNIEAFP